MGKELIAVNCKNVKTVNKLRRNTLNILVLNIK